FNVHYRKRLLSARSSIFTIRGQRSIKQAASGSRSVDLPPINALKPWLVIERAKHGFVTAGLLIRSQRSRCFIPGCFMWRRIAGEASFGEYHWPLIRFMGFLYYLQDPVSR